MKTVNFTPQEMNARVARFKELKPQSSSYDAEVGIPKEVYEAMTARTLYLLMSPENQGGPMAQAPAVVTEDKMSVIIAECPPGDGPLLHAHQFTREPSCVSTDSSRFSGAMKARTNSYSINTT